MQRIDANAEHYFELSHPDAARALDIYRTFVKQTDAVVQYLAVARQYEHATRLEIPKVKHAPLSLAASLEEYLNDRDFETNRKQYLAQQEAKKSGRPTNGVGKPTSLNKPTPSRPAEGTASRQAAALAVTTASPTREEAKGPAPDLIDFFESIEQNQQTLGQVQPGAPHELQQTYTGYNSTPVFTQTVPTNLQQQQQQQQAGAPGLVANPYGQPAQMQGLPNTFSMPIYGNAFAPQSGPFGVQSTPLSTIPQNTAVDFSSTGQQQQQQLQPNFTAPQFSSTFQTQQSQQIQPQSTNPFRHSMMPAHATGTSFDSSQNRLSTNPFAKPSFDPSMPTSSTGSVSYASPSSAHPPLPGFQSPFQAPFQAQPISSSLTGTNPFARPGQDPSHMPLRSALPTGPALATQQTGSTNPFRQSAFVHPQTGQSWQSGPQGTMGGLEQLGTIPVFPRPA